MYYAYFWPYAAERRHISDCEREPTESPIKYTEGFWRYKGKTHRVKSNKKIYYLHIDRSGGGELERGKRQEEEDLLLRTRRSHVVQFLVEINSDFSAFLLPKSVTTKATSSSHWVEPQQYCSAVTAHTCHLKKEADPLFLTHKKQTVKEAHTSETWHKPTQKTIHNSIV